MPTFGHTKGHCVLFYKNYFLFTGDHLWWSRERNTLSASEDVCWYSWTEQMHEQLISLPLIPDDDRKSAARTRRPSR